MKISVYQDKMNIPVFNKSGIDMSQQMVDISSSKGKNLKLQREGGHILMKSICPIFVNSITCVNQEKSMSEFKCTLTGGNEKLFYVTLEKEELEKNKKELFLHRHDFFEFVFLLNGKLTHYIGDKTIQQKPGEVLLVDDNTVHGEEWQADYQAIYITMSKVKMEALGNHFMQNTPIPQFLKKIHENSSTCDNHMIFRPIEVNGILEILGQVCKEALGKRYGYEYILWGLILRMVSFLNDERQYESTIFCERCNQEEQIFFQIRQFLEEQNGNVKVDDLIKKFHYSSNYFNEVVKKYTDNTFTEYRQSVRLKKAKELLITTQLSVRDIVQKVGYENRVYFYRVFREETGMTPHEYRTLQSKEN